MEPQLKTSEDGHEVELRDISESVVNVSESDGKSVAVTFLPDKTVSFDGLLERKKSIRCKSRNRFVKLLMSIGISKREAETLAPLYRLTGRTYQQAWDFVSHFGIFKSEEDWLCMT